MDPQNEPSSLTSQSEVAVLVASNDSNTNPVVITPTRRNDTGPQESAQILPPSGGERSGQISSGRFPSSKPFSVKTWMLKKLPIIKWLPKYKVQTDLIPDTISGVTVGLTAVPQSIAYANVAGLTPEVNTNYAMISKLLKYGLYSSFISCFVYLFLGSCRQMTIGPTAVVELLVYQACGENFASCVILVGFWVGVIQFLMGLLKLGAVVTLISDPVVIGFVAGASLTISSSQIKSFLGLGGAKGSGFIGYIEAAIKNIGTIKAGDSILGVSCVIFLLFCKNLKEYVKPSNDTISGKVAAKLIWLLSIARNAIVVITASIIAACLHDPPFALTGDVKSGFPHVGPPEFLLPASHFSGRNETNNGTLTFWETWQELNTAPLMIAIISILQNVAIAKAFGSGQKIDATQEMIALGTSHVIASFFSAMPTSGSFTRSAVNEASGVRSPVGGIVTALLIIFAMTLLTDFFFYIPKACLAAVILSAVIPMIEYESIIPMWKVSKTDCFTAIATFIASLLLGMEYGILIGVGISLIFYIWRPVRPHIYWSINNIPANCSVTNNDVTEKVELARKRSTKSESADIDLDDVSSSHEMMIHKTYILVCPEQGQFKFPSVDAIRSVINKLALSNQEIKLIILDCENMINMDYTSSSALCSLVKALKKTGKTLVFLNCKEEWACMMKDVGLKDPQCYNSINDIDF